ncbi:hypothetical protein ACFQ1I_27165 [Kitasatospora arboriphila]
MAAVPPQAAEPDEDLAADCARLSDLVAARRHTEVVDLAAGLLPRIAAAQGDGAPLLHTVRTIRARTLLEEGRAEEALAEYRVLAAATAAERGPYDPAALDHRQRAADCLERLGRARRARRVPGAHRGPAARLRPGAGGPRAHRPAAHRRRGPRRGLAHPARTPAGHRAPPRPAPRRRPSAAGAARPDRRPAHRHPAARRDPAGGPHAAPRAARRAAGRRTARPAAVRPGHAAADPGAREPLRRGRLSPDGPALRPRGGGLGNTRTAAYCSLQSGEPPGAHRAPRTDPHSPTHRTGGPT